MKPSVFPRPFRSPLHRALLVLPALLLLRGTAPAASQVPRPGVAREAEIVSVQGEGAVRFAGGADWVEASRRQVLTGGDRVRTGGHGRMGILFAEGVQIKVHRNTTLTIKPSRGTGKGTSLGMEIGEVWSRARAVPGGLRIETPSATSAVRGTEWDVQVDGDGTSRVAVLRGSIEFYNDFGRVTVAPGEQATAVVGRAPVKTTLVRPGDRVQWVVSYSLSVPDLVRFRPLRREEALRKMASERGDTLLAAELLYDLRARGESRKAVEGLLAAGPGDRRARVLRGFLALDAGRVEEARSDFEAALAKAGPGEGDDREKAMIGLAGVHAAENETGKADALLSRLRGEGRTPDVDLVSAAFEAYLGDFRSALRSCAEASDRHPGDERFRVLSASLSLLVDERGKARAHVAAALALDPGSSAAHAVLGSCEYLEGNGKAAEEAYRRSLALDPGNAGTMNGLGLLLMDRGYYDEARAVLSRAVQTDPRGSMPLANRGVLNSLVEELGKARADFEGSLAIDPGNYAALNGRGWVSLKEGKTDEAVKSFLEASLLEPRHSQSRTFLAIAYYQQGHIERALEELALAESLDPKDPFPHLVAYVIHQDTYRIGDAVREAGRVLELIPNLKSVDEIANTRTGLSNLGSALSTLGLSSFAESYAQESFDPHVASSHFFASQQYNTNSSVTISELTQGLLLDPLAVSSPTRYQDIVRRPRTDVSLSATLGRVQGDDTRSFGATAQGYTRELLGQSSWSLSATGHNNEGYVANGDSESYSLVGSYGAKPDEKNGFYVSGYYTKDRGGYIGSAADPDPDDRLESTYWSAEAGYHHKFGPKNELLARVAGGRTEYDLTNPSAYGNGLSSYQLSFLEAGWTAAETAAFFRRGVYDLTENLGWGYPVLATDSTGTVAGFPLVTALPSSFPAVVDTDPRTRERTTTDTLAVQLRRLFRLGDAHEITWGAEFIPFRDKVRTAYNRIDTVGGMEFYEEVVSAPVGWVFPQVSAASAYGESSNSGRFLFGYLDDRWAPGPGVLLNAGAFVFGYEDDNNRTVRVCPKIGLAASLGGNHVLRTGYQRWVELPSIGTLAPLTNAGLVINNSLAIDASRIEDYQARIESRWTGRLFTVIGAERVALEDPAPEAGYLWRSLRADFLDAAVNAILSEQLGFHLRHRYSDAEADDGPLDGRKAPGLPRHTTTGGIVWVSPRYVKASLSASYCTDAWSDYTNTTKEPSFLLTSLSVTWEPLRKRLLLGAAVSNLVNEGRPAPPRSASATVAYRF